MKWERLGSVTDRTLNRVLRWVGITFLLGLVAFGVLYYLDQRVDTGPSLLARQVQLAEQAVVNAPANIPARLDLARTYQLNSQLDKALKQYDEILRVDPGHRGALLGRGRALFSRGDLSGAAVPLRKITGTAAKGEFAGADTQLQEAYYFLGAIEVQTGESEQATADLDSALRIEPTDSDALFMLGRALLAQDKPGQALKALRRAVMFVPKGWADPYVEMARAYGLQGNLAGQAYAQAMAQFCQGDIDGATVALKPLAKGPMAVDSMLGLALIAEVDARRDQATKWYRRVLARDPQNLAAKSGLNRLTSKTAGVDVQADATNHAQGSEGSN